LNLVSVSSVLSSSPLNTFFFCISFPNHTI
jgi:hypothetical protein